MHEYNVATAIATLNSVIALWNVAMENMIFPAKMSIFTRITIWGCGTEGERAQYTVSVAIKSWVLPDSSAMVRVMLVFMAI